jgi:hypothetical protein
MMATIPADRQTPDTQLAERDRLLTRLHRGYAIVETALAAGDSRATEWEETWLALLARYEAIEDQLAGRPPPSGRATRAAS